MGTPNIYNHSKELYNAGSQNWDVKFNTGHIFFANNGGLLSYDGVKWNTLPTPNNTIMRSLVLANNERIYVGAQNELGFIEPDNSGRLIYTDLKDSIDQDYLNFSEIWDIEYIDDKLYFSSDYHINVYHSTTIKQYGHNSLITNMSRIDSSIWYHAEQHGIYVIENGIEQKLPQSERLNGFVVRKFLRSEMGHVYIITEKNGIYYYKDGQLRPWQNNANDYLINKRVSSALYDEHYGLFVGTYLGGLVSIDEKGLCKLKLSKKNGLQNNAINCMSLTPNGILWLGTNNGIDEVDISTAFRKFYPDSELEGAVYDFDEWKGRYFFSTSNGLYHIEKKDYYNPLDEDLFELIPGTEGQTWATNIIDDHLYCAHHEGAFRISNGLNAEKVSDHQGAWKFEVLDKGYVALGTYFGVILFRKRENGKLEFVRKIQGLEESSRIMVFDRFKNLWVSHPYKNLYRISFSDDYAQDEIKVYTKEDGFKTDVRNYVFNIKDNCYLTNATGIYNYNASKDSFELNETLNQYFLPGNHVRRLIQSKDKIWVISDNATSRFTLNNNGLENELSRMDLNELDTRSIYIGGFEELFVLNEETLIISSEDGAVEYSMRSRRPIPFKVSIKSISLQNQKDSIVYGGIGEVPELELRSHENAIRIEYNCNYPNATRKNQFSIRDKKNNENWSEWSSLPSKEYTNLAYGDHEFELRASTQYGLISDITTIRLHVKPPWTQGTLANIFYVIVLIGAVMALILIPRKKYKLNTSKLEQEKKKTEEAMENIKQEKLLDEIKFKNQELASNTLHLMQKNQTLITLKTKFDELKNMTNNQGVKKELNNILSIFREDLRLNDDWDKFSIHFDEVHHDFIKKIKSKYPNLSTNDHKLCAYLKMNLTTKEIAPLLNISVRGVEISRYRLRKKLELDRSVNLNDFFNSESFNNSD